MDENFSAGSNVETAAQSMEGDQAHDGGGGEALVESVEDHFEGLRQLARDWAAVTVEGTPAERVADVYPDDIAIAFRTIYHDPIKGHIPLIEVYDRQKGVRYGHVWFSSVEAAIGSATERARECARADASQLVAHVAMSVATYGDKVKVKSRVDIPDNGTVRKSAEASNTRQAAACIAELDENPLSAYRRLLDDGLTPTMVVASGGIAGEGDRVEPKLHCYFCLTTPAEGADLKRVQDINVRLSRHVGGDRSFKAIGHAIRIPGGLHRKRSPRPTQIINHEGPRYGLAELEAILDRVVPAEPERPRGTRKSATEKAKSWQEWRERIRTGDDTHAAMCSYACSKAHAGFDVDAIVADILDVLEQRGDGHKYSESEIARIVNDALGAVENSDSFQNSEDIRRKVAIMRDPAQRVVHKSLVDAAIERLTPDSVKDGPDALDDLLNEIGLLLPDKLEARHYTTAICGKINRKWGVELPGRIKRAADRAGRLLNRQDATVDQEADARPLIDLGTVDHDVAIRQTWEAIDSYNGPDPKIFRGPGGLSRVVDDLKGTPIIMPLDLDAFANEMKHAARWRRSERGSLNEAPVASVLRDMLVEKAPPVLPLYGVITTPRVAQDGTINTTPGYQSALQVIYRPDAGFTMPAVPDSPTPAELARAATLIVDNLLEGFPFRDLSDPSKHASDISGMLPNDRRRLYGQSSRANAVAALLTPFARPLIAGPTPLFLLNKTQPRTGASKLADAISRVVFGRPMSVQALPETDREFRVQITTWVDNALQMVVLDNVNDFLASGALAGGLTATWWQDRALGENRLVSGPINWLWMATGNNITTSSEIADRSVMVRQVPGVAEPQLRTDFKHSNLEAWIAEYRGELVWACLVLIKHWLAEGAPKDEDLKFGGFDDWARTLDGILRCAGIPGFLANRRDIKAGGVNTEGRQLQMLLTAWREEFGDKAIRVGNPQEDLRRQLPDEHGTRDGGLLRLMWESDIGIEGVNLGNVESARSALGKKLVRWKGATVDLTEQGVIQGLRHQRILSVEIEETEDAHHKSLLWRLAVKHVGPWTLVT